MRLISWNVNGVRSALSKGLLDFMTADRADVFCFQETKATAEQVQEVAWPKGYHAFWNPAQKKGYSGTAVFSRERPESVSFGLGIDEHDREGRVITLEFADFNLVNVYTPNSRRGLTRLEYRTGLWDRAFRDYVLRLNLHKPVILCGDLNVAHTEIDLANPKANVRNAGFTIEERESFGQLLAAGFLDSFRQFEPGPGHYSWWSYRNSARARNIGWRIDYFCVSAALGGRLKSAFIRPEVPGSDHCPVGLILG
jgi:exodeoxyribonuclease III